MRKRLLKKTISLVVAMATLCIGFASTSCEEEIYDNSEEVKMLFNPKAEKQSLLYAFLQGRLLMLHIAAAVKKNEACNYCQLEDRFSFQDGIHNSLKSLGLFQARIPSLLEIVWAEEILSISWEKNMKNCDLCELLELLPFASLFFKLYDKLTELQNQEFDLLREKDSEVAEELNQFLTKIGVNLTVKNREQNAKFEKLYRQVEKIGNFPNLLDKLTLFNNTGSGFLNFMENLNSYEDSIFFLMLNFADELAMHKKFLEDNEDTLSIIERIADNKFILEDGSERKIKTLAEIMFIVEKVEKKQNRMKMFDCLIY